MAECAQVGYRAVAIELCPHSFQSFDAFFKAPYIQAGVVLAGEGEVGGVL